MGNQPRASCPCPPSPALHNTPPSPQDLVRDNALIGVNPNGSTAAYFASSQDTLATQLQPRWVVSARSVWSKCVPIRVSCELCLAVQPARRACEVVDNQDCATPVRRRVWRPSCWTTPPLSPAFSPGSRTGRPSGYATAPRTRAWPGCVRARCRRSCRTSRCSTT